jgi:hypothetical protein
VGAGLPAKLFSGDRDYWQVQCLGSPLELRYMFRLNEQGKIARLDISL